MNNKKSKKRSICDGRKLKKFAKEHGFHTHPKYPSGEWAKLVRKSGHCPCSEIRPRCPCGQCISEVKKDGHCKCCFFVSDSYLEEFGYSKSKKSKSKKSSKNS